MNDTCMRQTWKIQDNVWKPWRAEITQETQMQEENNITTTDLNIEQIVSLTGPVWFRIGLTSGFCEHICFHNIRYFFIN